MARRNARKTNSAVSAGDDYFIPRLERSLTNQEVFRLAGDLRSDRGSPEQARALIAQFVSEAYSSQEPSRELLVFVRDSLAEYLETGKSLESAFRLKKGRRGRPRVPEKQHLASATELLRRRVVLGESFEAAAECTAEFFHTSRTVVCDAFSQHKVEALNALQAEAIVDMENPEQRARLNSIFNWLVPAPGDGN